MEFHHHFRVQAPLSAVQRFHSDPTNLVRLTPPPVGVELIDAPDPPRNGDRMIFVLSLGPLAIPSPGPPSFPMSANMVLSTPS